MSYLIVKAGELKIGDQLNMGVHFAVNPNNRWADIKKLKTVKISGGGHSIVVYAGGKESWFLPEDTVSIQRFDNIR